MHTEAVQALDNMTTIVRNEMLAQGTYLTPCVVNDDLAKAGAICGGHQACAVGSLYLAAGIKPQGRAGLMTLPGVVSWERNEFLAEHPALRLAYDALNAAAKDYADERSLALSVQNELGDDGNWTCEVEALFETYYHDGGEPYAGMGPVVNRADLLLVIEAAKARLV